MQMMFRGRCWHFLLFSLFYCLRIKASIVQLCLNSYTLTLNRISKYKDYSQEIFPCLKSLVVGIIRSFLNTTSFLKSNIDPALINQVLAMQISKAMQISLTPNIISRFVQLTAFNLYQVIPLNWGCTAKSSELKMASSKRSVTVFFAAVFLIGGSLSHSSEYIIY